MHISKYKSLLLCLLLAGEMTAQQELMLSSMPDLWHSNSINPAIFPAGKRFFIGGPAYSLDAAHSSKVAYGDIFRKDGNRTLIDLGNVINKLDPENEVFFDQRIETVSLGIRSKNDNWGLQIGHAIVTSGWGKYPKSLAEVLWYGNAPYIGQTLEIGPKADIFDWHEWSVGLSRRFGQLDIGARFKFLTGAGSLQTDENRTLMSIYTDPDIYQLTLKTDYVFYSSSIVEAVDTAGYGYKFRTNSFGGQPSFQNAGMAFDVGFRAQLSEHLSIHASALNLGGSIEWKENVSAFTSSNQYFYEGANIPGIDIINGSDNLDFDAKLDTLNDIFQFEKSTPDRAFKSELPLRIFAGGNYQLTERWSLGFSAMYQSLANRTNTALGVSARWQVLRWVSLGGMYSANSRTPGNLGFHLLLNPGPLQVYVLSDNLLNGFSAKNSPAVNFRLGGALVF
ncbi:MAG: hypothetical protein KIS77_08035 [Saprospiraceae bacterium]|nr:hypothetical protein [Saprospiraceae bacterium]